MSSRNSAFREGVAADSTNTFSLMNSRNAKNREIAGTDTFADATNMERRKNQNEHETGNADNAIEENDVFISCQIFSEKSPFLIEKCVRESLCYVTFGRHRSDEIIRLPFKIAEKIV